MHSGAEEYCLPEVFHAECAATEIILMERAAFGRMELGRCVTRNYGHVGCAVDVLHVLDLACSGHRSCELSVSDPALVRTKPCPKDFASYLDAEYRCVAGRPIRTCACNHCQVKSKGLFRPLETLRWCAHLGFFVARV